MKRFAFPITLETQENGWILVSYPDVPEALTVGETEQEALAEAQDCLIGALGGYIANGWSIPVPSAGESNAIADLPEDVTLKLSLYTQMLQRNISPSILAERAGKTEAWVDQLLNLDEPASPEKVKDAIRALPEPARRHSSNLTAKSEGLPPAF